MEKVHGCLHVNLDITNEGIPRQLQPVKSEFKMENLTKSLGQFSKRILTIDDIKRQEGELKEFVQKVYLAQTNEKIKKMIYQDYPSMVITGTRADVRASLSRDFNQENDIIIVPTHKNRDFLSEAGLVSTTCHSQIGRTHRKGVLYCSLDYFEDGMLYTAIGRRSGQLLSTIQFFSLNSF